MGNSFPKIPNEMDIKIDKILLKAELTLGDHLLFYDLSQQLWLSGEHNSVTEKLRKELELVIVDSIKQSVREKYMNLKKYKSNMLNQP